MNDDLEQFFVGNDITAIFDMYNSFFQLIYFICDLKELLASVNMDDYEIVLQEHDVEFNSECAHINFVNALLQSIYEKCKFQAAFLMNEEEIHLEQLEELVFQEYNKRLSLNDTCLLQIRNNIDLDSVKDIFPELIFISDYANKNVFYVVHEDIHDVLDTNKLNKYIDLLNSI
ncbi:hypothetical protein V7183_04265 [Bacillus sp. JJ1127]|uniref:hypothetical protein n=1 Tax=Bacillus sp. JJ1127 TaxID=3122952 RepID=UPI0030002887